MDRRCGEFSFRIRQAILIGQIDPGGQVDLEMILIDPRLIRAIEHHFSMSMMWDGLMK